MKTFEQLHDEAMYFADLAYIEKRKATKNETYVAENTRKAYELEKEAVLLLATQNDYEPLRSIYFRSAITLAMELKEYREAEKLICYALTGNPPIYLVVEFRKVWKKILKEFEKTTPNPISKKSENSKLIHSDLETTQKTN